MVVKVLHADIEKKVAVDMDILAGLAQLAEMIPDFRNCRPAAVEDETCLLALTRYIHLNPVKTAACRRLAKAERTARLVG